MNGTPRVLCAGLFHETHTFVEGSTPLASFEVRRGKALLECLGDSSPWGGALAKAQALGWRVEPIIDVRAVPSGIADDAVLEEFWKAFLQSAQRFQESEIDGILLILHGAMATPSFADTEGELLRRIRQELGWKRVPISAVLDLHANVTEEMARYASSLVSYCENPHTDARATAERAATLLDRQMRDAVEMRTTWRGTRIVWPPAGTGTASSPMKKLEVMARALERDIPGVLAVNVCAGFSFADTPQTGVSFSVVHCKDCREVDLILDQLAAAAWAWREMGNVRGVNAREAIERVKSEPGGLIVFAEEADNIGGGAPGDGTGLLREFIAQDLENAAICLNDPLAVEQLWDLAPGARTTLPLGGRGSRYDAGPLSLEVEIQRRCDGRFELEDKQSHMASLCGDVFEMGPSVLVRHAGIAILLTTNRTPPMDLGQWLSVGIDPSKLNYIGVKAAIAHRRAYDPIARMNLLVETAGPCCGDLSKLDYQQIRRPVFPLDPLP